MVTKVNIQGQLIKNPGINELKTYKAKTTAPQNPNNAESSK